MAASGGSTNSVLHLIALARETGIPLTIDDFDEISRRTPLFCDMMPGGKYSAFDLDLAGGTPVVAKRMVDAGLVHADALTVTGKTFAEAAQDAKETPGQDVIHPVDKPIKDTPKEQVRQRIVRVLFHEYQFAPEDMELDFVVQVETAQGENLVQIG